MIWQIKNKQIFQFFLQFFQRTVVSLQTDLIYHAFINIPFTMNVKEKAIFYGLFSSCKIQGFLHNYSSKQLTIICNIEIIVPLII